MLDTSSSYNTIIYCNQKGGLISVCCNLLTPTRARCNRPMYVLLDFYPVPPKQSRINAAKLRRTLKTLGLRYVTVNAGRPPSPSAPSRPPPPPRPPPHQPHQLLHPQPHTGVLLEHNNTGTQHTFLVIFFPLRPS